MTKANSKRRVNAERLRRLGFRDDLIAEAVAREERGVLEIEPPADLVQSVIERTSKLLPQRESSRRLSSGPGLEYAEALPSIPTLTGAAAGIAFTAVCHLSIDPHTANLAGVTLQRCRKLGTFAGKFAESLEFALRERDRPLMILQNHNIIEPRLWGSNRQLKNICFSSYEIDHFVSQIGQPASGRIDVLCPDAQQYQEEDLDQLRSVVGKAEDLWWISAQSGRELAYENVTVVGANCVFRITTQMPSAIQVLGCMAEGEEDDVMVASKYRLAINEIIAAATQIKKQGALTRQFAAILEDPGGIRGAIEMVNHQGGL